MGLLYYRSIGAKLEAGDPARRSGRSDRDRVVFAAVVAGVVALALFVVVTFWLLGR